MKREEIPLNFLLNQLEAKFGSFTSEPTVRSVAGGSINQSFQLDIGHFGFFVKMNSRSRYPNMFELEMDGLEVIQSTNTISTPNIVNLFYDDDRAMLVMEFIREGQKPENYWSEFGQRLARMHKQTHVEFGYSKDNYIGSLDQINDYRTSWSDFFVEMRIEPQLRLAERYFTASERDAFQRLFYRLEKLIPAEPPALLHGDLWGGNYLTKEDGEPVLIDPAVYYGHREMDISMMHLFGGFSTEVFRHYNAYYPLETGWEDRIDLHNIYPLLVHLNLFGASYLGSIKNKLKKYI